MIRALMILTLTAFSVPTVAASASPSSGKKATPGREATRSFKVAGLTGKGAVELDASHWRRRSRKAMPLNTRNDSQ